MLRRHGHVQQCTTEMRSYTQPWREPLPFPPFLPFPPAPSGPALPAHLAEYTFVYSLGIGVLWRPSPFPLAFSGGWAPSPGSWGGVVSLKHGVEEALDLSLSPGAMFLLLLLLLR